MNHFLMAVFLNKSSTVAPLRSASYMMNCRWLVGLFKRSISSCNDMLLKCFAKPRPGWPFSNERIAFKNASLYVLPMLMTSPTARICVPRTSSTPLNFSNAQRANFTTT